MLIQHAVKGANRGTMQSVCMKVPDDVTEFHSAMY